MFREWATVRAWGARAISLFVGFLLRKASTRRPAWETTHLDKACRPLDGGTCNESCANRYAVQLSQPPFTIFRHEWDGEQQTPRSLKASWRSSTEWVFFPPNPFKANQILRPPIYLDKGHHKDYHSPTEHNVLSNIEFIQLIIIIKSINKAKGGFIHWPHVQGKPAYGSANGRNGCRHFTHTQIGAWYFRILPWKLKLFNKGPDEAMTSGSNDWQWSQKDGRYWRWAAEGENGEMGPCGWPFMLEHQRAILHAISSHTRQTFWGYIIHIIHPVDNIKAIKAHILAVVLSFVSFESELTQPTKRVHTFRD